MNWTSTRTPMWQTDCHEFRKARRPFEVRDVELAEDIEFCSRIAVDFGWEATYQGTTVRLFPRAPKQIGI